MSRGFTRYVGPVLVVSASIDLLGKLPKRFDGLMFEARGSDHAEDSLCLTPVSEIEGIDRVFIWDLPLNETYETHGLIEIPTDQIEKEKVALSNYSAELMRWLGEQGISHSISWGVVDGFF